MADPPDIYADGFGLTAGPFGVTLTLHRSMPTGEAGPHQDPVEIVARIRLSAALARAIADAFAQASAASSQVQAGADKKH
jgi:hypothetical protein